MYVSVSLCLYVFLFMSLCVCLFVYLCLAGCRIYVLGSDGPDDEDVVVMLARLETMLYFDPCDSDSDTVNMCRLGFMVLYKLATLVQNVSFLFARLLSPFTLVAG